MNRRAFLPALQVFRAVAALMVVLFHVWPEVAHNFGVQNPVLDTVSGLGRFGVDFFFVLSGFIICYAHMDKRGVPSAIPRYFLGRIRRIYIPYMPACLVMLILYWMFRPAGEVNVVKSLTLLPLSGGLALQVAWTLVHEMFFYVVFISFFLSRRWFGWLVAGWTVATIAYGQAGGLPGFVCSTYNLEFILGLCGAFLLERARLWTALALFAAVAVLWLFPPILENKLLLGALFLGVVLLGTQSVLNRVSRRSLAMILGNASYSIYLIHLPLITLCFRWLKPGTEPPYVWAPFTLLVILGICVAGVLYSQVFELHQRFKFPAESADGGKNNKDGAHLQDTQKGKPEEIMGLPE